MFSFNVKNNLYTIGQRYSEPLVVRVLSNFFQELNQSSRLDVYFIYL